MLHLMQSPKVTCELEAQKAEFGEPEWFQTEHEGMLATVITTYEAYEAIDSSIFLLGATVGFFTGQSMLCITGEGACDYVNSFVCRLDKFDEFADKCKRCFIGFDHCRKTTLSDRLLYLLDHFVLGRIQLAEDEYKSKIFPVLLPVTESDYQDGS